MNESAPDHSEVTPPPPGEGAESLPPPPAPGDVPFSVDKGSGDSLVRPDGRLAWWGMGDLALAAPVILGAVIFATYMFILISEGGSVSSDYVMPISGIVVLGLLQQVMQVIWPAIVSRWKGLGMASDWKLSFKPVDLGIGVGVALWCIAVGAMSSLLFTNVLGWQPTENTNIITDAEGSTWLYGILIMVLIGAPLSEELLFRGLALRSAEKRMGPVLAVIFSSLIFGLVHYQADASSGDDVATSTVDFDGLLEAQIPTASGNVVNLVADEPVIDGTESSDSNSEDRAAEGTTTGGWRGNVALMVTLSLVGAVLAIAAIVTNRLGAPIVAHAMFNLFGTLGALGVFGDLSDSTNEALSAAIAALSM